MTGRDVGDSAMSTRSGASSSRLYLRDQSAELEKLLGSSGDGPVLDADLAKARTYNVEMMVDELLSSTWEPAQPSGSSHSPRHLGSPTQTRRASFTQQTTSLNALQAVLADSIDRLVKHRRVISDRIGELEQDNRRVSVKYQEGLARPDLLLNQICEQMEDLEERFTKVSSTAVLIGDKLSTLDDERSRVLETDELMEALLALNDPSSKLTKSSNRLFNTLHDPAQLHEAAQIIKKMSVFSSELSSPTIAYAVAEIERLSQTIENNLLTEFSNEQEKDNLAGMRKCAESLIEYNDKEKVADRYVWNVMCDRLAKAAGEPTVASLDPIEDLDALFTKILTICEEQFRIIDAVFPTAGCDSVRELLVERLFNDPAFGILSYLEQFLNTRRYSGASTPTQRMSDISGLPPTPTSVAQAASNENREYVRLLCAAYEKTCSMALAIESIERPKQSAPNTSATTSNQVLGNDNPADDEHQTTMTADRERMHTFLSLQLHSLFGSHRQKYFQTELDLLQSHFKDTFGKLKFPQLPAISKHKASSSKAKNAATPAPAVSSTTPPPSVSSTQLVSVSASSISSSNFDKDGINTSLEASLVFYESLKALAEDENVPSEYADAMIKAVGRCEVILKGSELRGELITKVFSSFAASYGDEYLGKILSTAQEILQEPRITADSALQFFVITESLLQRIDFLDEQFEVLIAPSQADSPTQLTICQESKRKCLEKLESSIATGLQQVLQVIEKTASQLLTANQGKGDFIGGQGNMSLSCSKACQNCIEYLQPLVTTVCRVLMDENRNRFLIALSTTFKELYLQHLHKFRFDPDGACMLLRDVSEYRQAFRSPSRPAAVDDIFDLLHEVANVFALPPENLGGFVREGKLATLSKQRLLDIVKRRWDYKTNAEKISASLKDE